MSNCEQLKSDFEKFLLFQCENKLINPDDLIFSTINLLNNCAFSRCAILQFYGQIFDDLCLLHVNNQRGQVINGQHVLQRFLAFYDNELSTTRVRRISVQKEVISPVTNATCEDTPLSPTTAVDTPKDKPEVITDTNSNFVRLIERFVVTIRQTLEQLLFERDSLTDKLVIDWSIELLSTIPPKYTSSMGNMKPNEQLAEYIRLWSQCGVMKTLLDLVKLYVTNVSLPETNTTYVLNKLIQLSPKSDWICAYLLTSVPEENTLLLSDCIKTFLRETNTAHSATAIFSFLSEKNPKVVVNALKDDISFLLKLSFTSKPLLDLLSAEAAKEVNVSRLNKLCDTLEEDLKEYALFCILYSPNAFDLLKLLFEICLHTEANAKVQQQAYLMAKMLVKHLHDYVYGNCVDRKLPILTVLSENLETLVFDFMKTTNEILGKLQMRILHLLCMHFGRDFCTKVFHHMLNSLHEEYDTKTDIQLALINPIETLLQSLKQTFGFDIYQCLTDALLIDSNKKPRFWANLFDLIVKDTLLKLDLSKITENFTLLIQEDENYFSLFYLLKIIRHNLETEGKTNALPNHHLCISLIANYSKVLNDLYLPKYVQIKSGIISITHDCIQLLSKRHVANQHILCRSLLESELCFDVSQSYIRTDEFNETRVCLLNENLDYGTTFNFRKVPLAASLRDSIRCNQSSFNQMSSNKQYVFDAINSCVSGNLPLLANLLVEIVTPDVMFNEKFWPEDDFLKVTIERDLYIASKFQEHPILWSLCELIAKAGCLKHCVVLIRALIAVQITQWLSATSSKDLSRVSFTEKLFRLISKSEMVPKIPFKYLHLTLPYLNSYEIHCVMNDLWKFMKDSQASLESEENRKPLQVKLYFERLRLIAAQKFPGNLYVKLFQPIR